MKLVLFGGSFDPPHNGHIEIVNQCLKISDRVILMPTVKSPMKNSESSTESNHIISMLELLFNSKDKRILIDEYDLNRSGPSYTIDTIKYLNLKYPNSSISMALGADQLVNLKNWKNYKTIISLVKVIGFNRHGYTYTPYKNIDVTWLDKFNVEVSSSCIRNQFLNGKQFCAELPILINEYIINNKLYK